MTALIMFYISFRNSEDNASEGEGETTRYQTSWKKVSEHTWSQVTITTNLEDLLE